VVKFQVVAWVVVFQSHELKFNLDTRVTMFIQRGQDPQTQHL